MTRVLFIPKITSTTSERSPAMYRLLDAGHNVVGLSATWDRYLYDTERAKLPRYLLYLVDKAILCGRGLLAARRHRAEVVFCETVHHALPGLAIARILGLRCVWDSHGNVKLFAESMGKGWFFSHLAASLERFIGRRTDALITVAEQDVEAYAQMGVPRSKIHLIPTCIDVSAIGPVRSAGENLRQASDFASDIPVLLFFGMFKYAPNREALEFINDTVAPHLEQNGIRCEIQIAGRDIPDLPFHRLIKILGFVPDLHACIRSADLCLVPIWRGQGVKGAVLTKVLDIMAVGTASVMSEFSARGLPGVEDGVHALVAPSEEVFLRQLLKAIDSPRLRESMAKRARGLIAEHYDWELYRPHLDRILKGAPVKASGAAQDR